MEATRQPQIEDLMRGLGQRALMLRLARGANLYIAAAAIGVSPQTLGDIERGRRTPHAATLKAIADFYEVPVEALLDLPQDAA